MSDKGRTDMRRRSSGGGGGGCLVMVAAPLAAVALGVLGVKKAFADDNATPTAFRPNPAVPTLSAGDFTSSATAVSTPTGNK